MSCRRRTSSRSQSLARLQDWAMFRGRTCSSHWQVSGGSALHSGLVCLPNPKAKKAVQWVECVIGKLSLAQATTTEVYSMRLVLQVSSALLSSIPGCKSNQWSHPRKHRKPVTERPSHPSPQRTLSQTNPGASKISFWPPGPVHYYNCCLSHTSWFAFSAIRRVSKTCPWHLRPVHLIITSNLAVNYSI